MRPDPIEKAVAEISRGLVVEDGLPESTRKGDLTSVQVWKRRARTEKVLIAMCDEMSRDKAAKQTSKRRRARRRGPKIVVWRREAG